MKKLKFITILLFIECIIYSQSFKYENKGLYPNSIQLTINAPVESVGIIYGYLFQKPFLGLPIGVYGEICSTIPENWRLPNYYMYNNYKWQRKYSIGMSCTLPHSLKDGLAHFMGTIGLVYNEHPRTNQDLGLMPGMYTPDVYNTTKVGCDLGVKVQIQHFTAHLKTDVVNFMRYTQFGAGYTFSFYN